MKDGTDTAVTEYHLPCAEALLAGTLALMTAHAQSRCPGHRGNMVGKIMENFAALTAHPAVSAPFRATLRHLQQHWQQMATGASACESSAPNVPPRHLH